jgi:flagellar hook-associated protein 2
MASTAESASRVASSTTDAVSIEVTMEALASDVSAVVEVNTLAASQIV